MSSKFSGDECLQLHSVVCLNDAGEDDFRAKRSKSLFDTVVIADFGTGSGDKEGFLVNEKVGGGVAVPKDSVGEDIFK